MNKALLIIFILFIFVIFGAPAFAGHQGIALQECTNCHIPNLITQHGGFSGADCAKCHSSTNINVINTIARGGTVYCSDCHGTATHTDKHAAYFSGGTGWTAYPGVEPGSAALWTQVTNFTLIDPATKEYQVCFKCHSYYAFGELENGVTDIVGPSGFNLTDQAMEFNPANKSAHPVEVTLNNMTGSYAQKALSSAQMLYPWNSNVGYQNMQCSDCHEVNPKGDPAAPQGANSLFPLKGTGKYWPRNKTNGLLWTLYDLKANKNNWKNDLFCVNCHPLYNGKFFNKVHDDGHHNEGKSWPDISKYPNGSSIPSSEKYVGAPCVMCHVAVPHGSKHSRLIAYKDDVFPYNYKNTVTTGPDKSFSAYHDGMMGVLTGYKKSTNPTNYDEKNCYIPKTETYGGQSGQPRWGCGDHDSKSLTYDP